MPNLLLLLAVAGQSAQAQSTDKDPSLAVEKVATDKSVYRVTIADPFIDLHTGPGSAYPRFHVIDRGTEVKVLRRKTDWFRIETGDGISGWASRDQMRETLLPTGEKFKVIELGLDDFSRRKWLLGVSGGEFESAPVFTLFGAYSFTANLAAEVHFGKSVGRNSSSTFIKANLVMQPFPELRYSPFMALGIGKIKVDPSATLIISDDETNSIAQFGLGVQRYMSRSFLFRFEVNEYIIFSSGSSDNNEEIDEWKFGFAVFF